MGVSGQHHVPAALYPRGKDPRYPLYSRLQKRLDTVYKIMRAVWIMVFWFMTPLNRESISYQRFRGTYCLHIQGRRKSGWDMV
jgi:hypothetical protein